MRNGRPASCRLRQRSVSTSPHSSLGIPLVTELRMELSTYWSIRTLWLLQDEVVLRTEMNDDNKASTDTRYSSWYTHFLGTGNIPSVTCCNAWYIFWRPFMLHRAAHICATAKTAYFSEARISALLTINSFPNRELHWPFNTAAIFHYGTMDQLPVCPGLSRVCLWNLEIVFEKLLLYDYHLIFLIRILRNLNHLLKLVFRYILDVRLVCRRLNAIARLFHGQYTHTVEELRG